VDSDLVYLEDQQAKRHDLIESFVEENVIRHQNWNRGWIDNTFRPITPPLEQPQSRSGFRPVFTSSQLPTPPASVSEDGTGGGMGDAMDENAMELEQSNKQLEPRRSARIRFASPPSNVPYKEQTRFRRRIGRGGRLWVDRRGVKRQKIDSEEIDERVLDRYAFSDDASDDDIREYNVDYTDNHNIRYRIMIERQEHRAQQQAAQSRRPALETQRSASGHLMPPKAE
jgi:enhancer of polycomb-like protein